MINLLPPDSARQLRAARHNSILIRYVAGGGIVLGLIVLVYLSAFALLKTTEASNTNSSEENQQKIDEYSDVAATAKEYRDNIQRARTILDAEISYTTALANIASSLPNDTVISSLALTPEGVGQPITLTVQAKSQQAALAVKEQLEKNNIARDITISSLSRQAATGEGAGAAEEYPFSINLNLTLQDTIFAQEEESDE